MASITQKVLSFVGGVSKQPDILMSSGQVRDAVNAYPDPTFGLIKRPGTKYITSIGTNNEFHTGKWFSIDRDGTDGYVGVIINGDIKIWNVVTGAEATITYEGDKNYLAGTYEQFKVLTVQDTSIITNTKVVVDKLADNFPAVDPDGKVTTATLIVAEANYSSKYTVTINGTTKEFTTKNAENNIGADDPPKAFLSVSDISSQLETLIKEVVPGMTIVNLGFALELTNSTPFSISTKSGQTEQATVLITDRVLNISELPSKSVHGRTVLVANSDAKEDDYYVKFIAKNGVSGEGYWEETIKPGASTGVKVETMPHQLINTGTNTFTYKPITWEPRLVGDDETNPHLSFVGATIQNTFFYQNRLGFLSDDNLCFSVAGEYYNFYHASALTQASSDPIDISVSSVKPGILHSVVPVAQGLVVFSDRQQFLVKSENGVLTPTSTTAKVIANYEVDPLVAPIDIGTQLVFISKTHSYTRVLNMVTRGDDYNPIVNDIGRIVADWIPKEIDQLVPSPQNEFFTVAFRDSPTLYMFKSYSEGEETLLSSWVRWTLPGDIKYHYVTNDQMYYVLYKDNKYYLCISDLNQSTMEKIFTTEDGRKIDPRLDLWAFADTSTMVWDANNRTTKVYLPHTFTATPKPIVVTVPEDGSNQAYSGFYTEILELNTDGGGDYCIVSGYIEPTVKLVVGYTYTFEVDLPATYYQAEKGKDYSATLTVARYKFAIGLSGEMNFQIKAKGRDVWLDRKPTENADYYLADYNPVTEYKMFTIPVHQKSSNHLVKVLSDTPFPTSLVSMTWEGNYSPRFYGRQ